MYLKIKIIAIKIYFNITNLFPDLATGTSIDYVKGTYETPFVYSYNLRDRNYYSFLLPPDQIIPTREETLDALVSMFKYINASGYYKKDMNTTL